MLSAFLMITYCIPCASWLFTLWSLVQVSRVQKMLGDEFGTASNIKSRVNRQSVLGAITSAQQRLKLYNKVGRLKRRRRPLASDHLPQVLVTSALCELRRLLLEQLQVPPNGLVVYTGTILTEEGKEKKLNIDFEPFKPINTSLYLCDNKFHTEALNELLESDNKCALRARALPDYAAQLCTGSECSTQGVICVPSTASLAPQIRLHRDGR